MKKLLIILVIIGVAVGLFALAVNSYVKPAPTTVPVSQYNQLKDSLDVQKVTNTVQELDYKAQLNGYTKRINDICTYAKTNKLVIPSTLCQ